MLLKPSTCLGCPLYGSGKGFVPADGTGRNGVLIVLEAAGEDESACGRPTVGRAGQYLWGQLARAGLEREDFKIHNVLSCQPLVPGFKPNFLAGAPYEDAAVLHCSPNLDATIKDMQQVSRAHGRTFTIVTLGRTAFKRIMALGPKDPILKEDYLCYPFWSQRYEAWILAGDHPSFIMRGNHHLVNILQFLVKRAVEIAADGIELDKPFYHLDPHPQAFDGWVREYLKHTDNPETFLSYDIETPGKAGKDESALAKEDSQSYQILRCSFSYKPGDSASVPWREEYMPAIKALFASKGQKVGWNSGDYDDPRIKVQVPMNGDLLDAMRAWHILNTAMPKGLGFVTPFYWKTTSMWKHLADTQPSFYNAKDADAALRCWLGIRKSLHDHNLWNVFDRHEVQVNRCFRYMSDQGLLLDQALRAEQEQLIAKALEEVELEIDKAIPAAARDFKVYKKTPKDTTGLVQRPEMVVVRKCSRCGIHNPTKPHFKVTKKVVNPCAGADVLREPEMVPLWAKALEFKISKTSLTRYQATQGHRPIIDRKENKVTFDEKAIIKLQKIYPRDRLYPLILKQRGCQKLLSTYIGRTENE